MAIPATNMGTLPREQSGLLLRELHGSRAFLVVIGDVVDAAAHGVAPHLAGVVGLQQFADGIHVSHPPIEPDVVSVWSGTCPNKLFC